MDAAACGERVLLRQSVSGEVIASFGGCGHAADPLLSRVCANGKVNCLYR